MPEENKRRLDVENWEIPSDLITRYATNLLVQSTDTEFILSFFETHPPMRFEAEADEPFREVREASTKCVARVVVSAPRMEGFLAALTQSHARWYERMTTLEDDEEQS